MEKPQSENQPPRINNRHTAKYFLVAHSSYHDQNGQLLRKANYIVQRCFSKGEANKFINEIMKIESLSHKGFDENGTIYKKTLAKAPKVCYSNNEGNIEYETIDRFSVVTKTDYLTME
jgi:hypothetical protein